ncbi:hypothetical protein BV25DRAFT_1868870 [Artomyces pyxidatus]|uniref:Uncharacterized protein n=1 Tax=Artomyces pyxidatus TaxID=48021 RepID=A0ACB8T971_9AGAM|nr:hypothetical protein BV25DRAFT_1868870 [Artomyces pyxidatus]
MADLTVLYTPSSRQSGLGFSFNRRATTPLLTPMVVVEMAGSPTAPVSPVRVRDESLLSPYTSRRHPSRRSRSISAPPLPIHSPAVKKTDSASQSVQPFPRPRVFSSTPSRPTPELVRPPPPLLRPRTFWRHTARSGVTSFSYSPSSHLVRRSTFVAAGLDFDRPFADLSAFGVESRINILVLPPKSLS